MKKNTVITMVITVSCLFGGHILWAQNYENKQERYELAEALERTDVKLAQGLTASESEGQPISGKFEMDSGKLQLSVYTMKGDKFSEVIIDHTTGKVSKTEAITSGEDLTAAKAQSEVMSKAKVSLREATDKAVVENEGFAAISVVPSLKDGRPVANVTLTNDEGRDLKVVSKNLD
ncbi:MAG: hypothetical protein HZB37_09620 [Planctomycetes bacterium]|nr:hypothetical protein [Candidatus Omnitrophota bacterium]MBI5308567.1 hypothetical protein [Planctomycetota bacterium]